MGSTLLAVDDSATMRKIVEMTFAGTDVRVVTADSPESAFNLLAADKPDVVLLDISLESKSGYDVCKEFKQRSPSTPVILLSSKQNPFDAARAATVQADDHVDKPYDTQQMIERVTQVLKQKGTISVAQAGGFAAVSVPSVSSPTAPPRAKTLVLGAPVSAPPTQPPPRPVVSAPPVSTRAPISSNPPPAPVATTSAAAVVANGVSAVDPAMATKLESLGLSKAQIEAVVALSREVVERVVWEVVPVLAETIIKEEITRLTTK